MTAEEEILALCDRLGEAHERKDPDAILACFAPDAVIYGLGPPLASRGMDRGETADWLASWDGPIQFDAHDVDLAIEGAMAVMTSLQRMRGTKRDGERVDFWFRVSTCFRKRDGAWLITHDHASAPFSMDGRYKAAIDLKPAGL